MKGGCRLWGGGGGIYDRGLEGGGEGSKKMSPRMGEGGWGDLGWKGLGEEVRRQGVLFGSGGGASISGDGRARWGMDSTKAVGGRLWGGIFLFRRRPLDIFPRRFAAGGAVKCGTAVSAALVYRSRTSRSKTCSGFGGDGARSKLIFRSRYPQCSQQIPSSQCLLLSACLFCRRNGRFAYAHGVGVGPNTLSLQ